ncbi:MAG: IPT/TIG domain-containing protein [Gaiellaceae bacterium]
MSRTVIRAAVSLSLVALVGGILALVGGSAAPAAPPQVAGTPQALDPPGFGHFRGDVRHIPRGNLVRSEARPEPKAPSDVLPGPTATDPALQTAPAASTATAGSPTSFVGLDQASYGAGWPPDPNGDVGPTAYVQTVNTSIGIFGKDGVRNAAFTFDSLFSQGATGTPCDSSNQGDPVAVYDPFGDRYIVSDFAWNDAQFSTGPFYECMAVSKTDNPLTGGWYFFGWKIETGASLPDYPKLGVWPDGIYMSANVFASTGSQSFQNAQVWAFNRTQMETGDPNAQGVTFSLARTIGGTTVFSLLPSNSRQVTGGPPAGAPNYFASIYGSYAIRVWKFHTDWSNLGNSTFSGPTDVGVSTFNVGPSNVPERDGNNLDTLSYRLMMQNQYTNLNGRESLWLTHTVGGASGTAQVRWYELPVTGGSISAVRQQSTWSPTATNRFMPSLAVDKKGDMAVGYSVSDASMYPALRYSGRLAGDPLNQLTQPEQTIVQGLGFQCCTFSDGSTNNRWGDYSAMTIDPDGCTFWYTGEYYDVHPTTTSGDNWQTRIGSFQLPGCSTVAAAPVVSTFTPGSGAPGTTVTVTGSGFSGASAVTFNGVASTFSVGPDTQLTATVPASATTGPIAVTTAGLTGTTSTAFTVTAAPAKPSIASFSPTSGKAGTVVTISGSGFTGVTAVAFSGTGASYTVVSETTISATVPRGAKSGPISVTNQGGTATSSQSFQVLKH